MGNIFTNENPRSNKRKRTESEDESQQSTSDDILSTPKRKKFKSTSKYIYQTLFLEGEDSDVTIRALNKDWKLHKLYLKQSPYFAGMFSGCWKESKMDRIDIDIIDENITEKSLKIAFGSLYNDYVFMKPIQVISILAAAVLLQLDELIKQCDTMMMETLSADTVCPYHEGSTCYGREEVRKICLNWMLQNLLHTQDVYFIKELSVDLMESLLGSADLFVLQVEIDVYSVLKKYVFLRLNQDWSQDVKDLPAASERFFKTKLEGTSQCFLETDEGQQFQTLFTKIRWVHVINDLASIKLLETDRIVPIRWLDPVFSHNWRKVLSIEQGLDTGPDVLADTTFNRGCTRTGRLLTRPAAYCWRWVGYNYGLDILLSFNSSFITLKRNTHTQQCPHSVSLVSERNLCYRLTVCHVDENGREKAKKTTGIKRISLGKDEEEIAMVLDDKFEYPLIVSLNLMTLSPKENIPSLQMPG